jgi:hypothetical protein
MRIASVKLSLFFAVLSASSQAAPIVTSLSGPNPAGIQTAVDAFRTALGTLNPNVAGSVGTGRREINWDGVPDALAAPNSLPVNFFNANSPRGVVFSGAPSFQVSANAAAGPVRFGNVNATYSNTFQTFSAQRLFSAIGTNVYDVSFFVPGTSIASFTSAFGAVFTDVDLANTSSIQFFDTNNNSLGTFFAPAANNGLSFLGVQFSGGEKIARVRITQGNAALGPIDSSTASDVVVADDFIYAEPAAVPEPAALTMMTLAAGIFALCRNRLRNRS